MYTYLDVNIYLSLPITSLVDKNYVQSTLKDLKEKFVIQYLIKICDSISHITASSFSEIGKSLIKCHSKSHYL